MMMNLPLMNASPYSAPLFCLSVDPGMRCRASGSLGVVRSPGSICAGSPLESLSLRISTFIITLSALNLRQSWPEMPACAGGI